VKRLALVLIGGVSLLATGCSTNVSRFQMPGTDLDAIRTLYIDVADDERQASELRSLIVANLKQRGYAVATKDANANLQDGGYVFDIAADWHWDITWYLIELRVAIYEAKNNTLVAQAQSQQSSLARKSIEDVVNRALEKLFNDPMDSNGGDRHEKQINKAE
jgi:hypothetical protein